jgi:MFS transporter, PHS family, inorganic phosphate transporter
MPRHYEIALSVVTLGGPIIGQIAFGPGVYFEQIYEIYGLELIITIATTLRVVLSSNGVD